jgi:NAD dependent epimerase/dehydratase
MKTLVTGAEGFIGSHLVERLLRDGNEVRAFIHYNFRGSWGWLEDLPPADLKRIEIVPGDVRDPFAVREAVRGCSQVFHLAALIAIPYSYRAPMDYVQTNVVGTLNVMQACRDEKVEKVVHTSTSEVYGSALTVPIDEKHPLQGQSPYSASKIGADKIAESFYLSFGLPVVTVRPFNTYGPRQSARAVIPTIITQALHSDVIRLGSLDPVRDLNFVADTAAGFVAASRSAVMTGETVNLCNGQGITIGELAEMIQQLLGVRKKIVVEDQRVRPEKSEVTRLIGDNRKAREKLGWSPQTSLPDGLKSTIEWMRTHLHHYKPELYAL